MQALPIYRGECPVCHGTFTLITEGFLVGVSGVRLHNNAETGERCEGSFTREVVGSFAKVR